MHNPVPGRIVPGICGNLFLDDLRDGRSLCHEVRERLAFDRLVTNKVQIKLRQLHRPLDDAPSAFSVPEDPPQWIRGNHRDLVRLEVVAQLPGSDEKA